MAQMLSSFQKIEKQSTEKWYIWENNDGPFFNKQFMGKWKWNEKNNNKNTIQNNSMKS